MVDAFKYLSKVFELMRKHLSHVVFVNDASIYIYIILATVINYYKL